MIATILLIAFTVAIGGIISVWMSGLATTQTTTVSSTTEKQIKCAASTLAVKEVKYLAGTNLVNVTVTYQSGTENLYNLTIEVSGGGATSRNQTASASSWFTTTADPFEPGESFAVTINAGLDSPGASIPPEYVRAKATCQSAVGIIGECKSGDVCMKSG
jgi:FlaG/FlaF family flagellin (archaellin)